MAGKSFFNTTECGDLTVTVDLLEKAEAVAPSADVASTASVSGYSRDIPLHLLCHCVLGPPPPPRPAPTPQAPSPTTAA